MKKLYVTWLAAMLMSVSGMVWAAVDLNTANKEELEAVKGIGPVKAQAIIEYRQKHGLFRKVDDLKQVSGFGDKSVARLRKELSVSEAKPAASGDKAAAK